MDKKDSKILEILKNDGRASYTEIAEKLDVSEGTVRNRVKNMREEGVIEKFTVETAQEDVSAIILAKLSTSSKPEKVIKDFPMNLTVYEVTGEHDLVINIGREDMQEINNVVDKIRNIEGVSETLTKSVLKETET